MREVDQATFAAAHGDGAVVIDVREPDEYVAGICRADLVPLSRLTSCVERLPVGVPVYVICARCSRSLAAADFFAHAAWTPGRSPVSRVWMRGRPVVHGLRHGRQQT